jgi:hypothetical protein
VKTVYLIAAIFGVSICGFAGEAPSQRASSITNGFDVTWNVPTNHLPSTLWVYRIVPQTFSSQVISNLMALGSLTMANRTNIEGQLPFKDERLLYFASSERSRYLGIFAPYGWIYYKDRDAEVGPGKHASGVPTEEEASQLALNYLRLFGIDRSQLATREGSTLREFKETGHHGWFDKSKGTNVMEVSLRGVFFVRRVDGIDFSGIGQLGGVHIAFGDNAKVAAVEIVWKGLEPYELHRVLNAEQILDAVRSGSAKWISPPGVPSGVKKITVNEVVTYYRGEEGDSDAKFIEPFALLAASIDYGYTNVPANLECSIISKEPMTSAK